MPYPVQGFLETNEDMLQILLMLEVLFTQDSEVKDLFCDASSGSEPNMFFSNCLFGLEFSLFKMVFSTTFFPKYLTGCISQVCVVGGNHGIYVHVIILHSAKGRVHLSC